MKRQILILFLSLCLFTTVSASCTVELYYGEGCPHCERALTYLHTLPLEEQGILLRTYEVYFNETERQYFLERLAAIGETPSGVPTILIEPNIYVGFSEEIAQRIKEDIQNCTQEPKINELGSSIHHEYLTLPAVVLAALIDAINPCAFAVLIILLTTILASTNKKKALLAGIAFSVAIFISYYLMGIGLYSAIGLAGITHTFYVIVAILAIILGLLNLKDYFWYGKWFVTEVPTKWRPKLKALIHGVTSIPGAFAIGFLVSLFLLPCTSGPYIVILGLLSNMATKNQALLYLLLYNFIFILPMILITLAVYCGITTTQKAEEYRQKHLHNLHLIAGILLLLLGIGMVLSISLGII